MTAESLPKHYVVRTHVEDLLADLSEGDPVPAERELAARCGVSRETVRQALHELLVAGRVERRGRGTVVARPKLVQPLSLGSYTEGALSQGREPGRILVRWEEIDAHEKLAEILEIRVGDPVIHLERVLLADGERIGLESTYLPRDRFPDLADTFDPETSLYAAIRSQGIVFTTATERIETALPTPREAGLVESSTAMPMLKLHRVSRDADGVPIERVRSLYRGDRMAFVTELR
ncbi:GntR family transcriptional regulator [Rhodococcus sp. ACT016]|uniref:GntR family transcriptional regulator n=1 Tax=Rhodococcus sp. ACT016 TaxID=3134808 RepID=UPI003D29D037